jgi:Holliday junction resolvasome RuvABC endonuclease subunit
VRVRRVTHLALDLALGSTGVAWADGSDVFTCPKKLTGGDRLAWWIGTINALTVPHWPFNRFVVEAPFMHAGHPSGSIPLIELHGCVRYLAFQHGVDYVTIPPATLKMLMCGTGKATKDDSLRVANELRPYDIGDHNEADAVLLWHWGAQ